MVQELKKSYLCRLFSVKGDNHKHQTVSEDLLGSLYTNSSDILIYIYSIELKEYIFLY